MKYVFPLAVSVALCWLLFRDIDFSTMWAVIVGECRPQWILLGLGISILSHVFRAMRWRLQLRALGVEVSLWTLTLSIFGTYAVNLVFPRLGEVWRTDYVARRSGASFAEVFGSMVADRLADTVTVALLTVFTFVVASAGVGAYLAQNENTYRAVVATLTSPWLWLGVVAAVAVGITMFVVLRRHPALVAAKAQLRKLWQGFASLATMPHKGLWLLLTVAVWGCYFIQLLVAFFAFDFTADIVYDHGITAVLLTFVLSSISMGVPSNGGIGPWQWAVIFALGIYGLEQARAGAFANLVLGCNTLLLIGLGIFTFICVARQKQPLKISNNK
ncbi:MAG: lysylphosphatidylglycerol synthase transmembrane domain-containing protein [Muribaculaceae bacterium]